MSQNARFLLLFCYPAVSYILVPFFTGMLRQFRPETVRLKVQGCCLPGYCFQSLPSFPFHVAQSFAPCRMIS
uniref:Uncharacterized protein n=1 Tax=Arundo donax TaxID=35708 RepID=A0A0A9CWH5_ARUDO